MRPDPARTFSLVIAVGMAVLCRSQFVFTLAAPLGALATPAWAQDESNAAAVTVEEDQSSFTLSNGIVTARVSKRSGDLTSLRYKGLETLTDKSGHAGGYWSHDTIGG